MSTLQSHSALQLQHSACFLETASGSSLLSLAGPIRGSHALVIGANGLDLMCDLLQQGCLAATTLHYLERPDVAAYDLVLAPQVTEASQFGGLARQAKRALSPNGRFVACLSRPWIDPENHADGLLVRKLRLAGFGDFRRQTVSNGLLIRADCTGRNVLSATGRLERRGEA